MPPRLPADIPTARVRRALLRLGFVLSREGGSHTVFAHPDHPREQFVLPRHRTASRLMIVSTLARFGFGEQRFLDVY
jgi:predicted RNA binding protein YcfA (HicA-like mRNA interferase family)